MFTYLLSLRELKLNLPVVYGWLGQNYINTGKPWSTNMFFGSCGWNILMRWFLPLSFSDCRRCLWRNFTSRNWTLSAQDASVKCGVGCCEGGWLERHNETHEWQITVGYVITRNKSLERFAFQTIVPVFVAAGTQPRRMGCLFSNIESLQQLVQQFFFGAVSKTWTPTPKMGREFAPICSIRI